MAQFTKCPNCKRLLIDGQACIDECINEQARKLVDSKYAVSMAEGRRLIRSGWKPKGK